MRRWRANNRELRIRQGAERLRAQLIEVFSEVGGKQMNGFAAAAIIRDLELSLEREVVDQQLDYE